jgi:hypothetical protein
MSPLQLLNISKDETKVLKDAVADVLIQTVENMYSGNPTYAKWQNAGYIPNAGVVITTASQLKEMIDGSNLSKGKMINIEITAEQLFSLYEFEKLDNQNCIIKIVGPGFEWWLDRITVTVEVNTTFNSAADSATISIKGSRKVRSLRDCLTPSPWAGPVSGGTGIPTDEPGFPADEDTPVNYWEYILHQENPLVDFETPANPDGGIDVVFDAGSAGTSIVLKKVSIDGKVMDPSGVNDAYNGKTLKFNGEEQTVTDYVAATKTITLGVAFAVDPVENDEGELLADEITEYKLDLVDIQGKLIEVAPDEATLVASMYIGSTPVVILDTAYDIVYEDGKYKFHYDSVSTPFILRDKISIVFDY